MKASVPVDLEKKEAFLWACYVIRMTYSSIRGHNVSWDIKSFLQNLQHAFMTEHQYWRLVLESRKRCGPAMEPPPSRRTSPRKMLTFADHYSAWVAMYQPFLDHLFWYLKSQSDNLTPASSCILYCVILTLPTFYRDFLPSVDYRMMIAWLCGGLCIFIPDIYLYLSTVMTCIIWWLHCCNHKLIYDIDYIHELDSMVVCA